MVDRIDAMLDMQQKTLDRIKRVESRLVQLMLYTGADPKVRYGEPQHQEIDYASTEARGAGDTSHQRP